MKEQEKEPLFWNGRRVPPLNTIDGKALLEADLPPIQFVIEKILPQGLFILAGSPKIGKSWLALDFCQSVGEGGQTLNLQAEEGHTLYLALEDSLTRLQSRLKKYTDTGTVQGRKRNQICRCDNHQEIEVREANFKEQIPNTLQLHEGE